MIDPLRSCLATNTESDRDCDPDSDPDSGSSTAIFLHVAAHLPHDILSPKLMIRTYLETIRLIGMLIEPSAPDRMS